MANRISTTPQGEEFEQKCFEVAFNFVNICAGSKTEAYRRYLMEHSENVPEYLNRCAYEFFKHKKVQEYIEKFRAENREKYSQLREENIAILKAISVDMLSSNKDKVAAVKVLNEMCGFNTQKVELTTQKELVIQIEE